MAYQIFGENCLFLRNSDPFFGRDSAEASAEASVKVAEASVSAESRFRPIRSFTIHMSSKTPTLVKCLLVGVPLFLSLIVRTVNTNYFVKMLTYLDTYKGK